MKDSLFFNYLSDFYKSKNPYTYAASHYIVPIVLLSAIVGNILCHLGKVHPEYGCILFFGSLVVSVVILLLTYLETK